MTAPNGKSVEVSALPDTGANISAICPKLSSSFGYTANELDDEPRKPRAADGNPLQTVGTGWMAHADERHKAKRIGTYCTSTATHRYTQVNRHG